MASSRRSSGTDERGETLAEVLMTISIMGILFAAVLGAIAVSGQTSDINHKDATAEALLRTSAEQIQGAAYVACAPAPAYTVAAPSDGVTVTVTAVRFWNGANPPVFAASGSPCSDQGVQAIDLKAQSSDGRALETLTVYKRAS
jgi:prepilin-type N-terminal cleavage/methylation domain-containing protein